MYVRRVVLLPVMRRMVIDRQCAYIAASLICPVASMQANALPAGLPSPDADSLAHSRAVADYIRADIAREGAIPFGKFMHHALYAPGLGYYVAGNAKFGPEGDFVTAPQVSQLFGRVVARQVASVLNASGGSVLELGAGRGELACQMLERLAEADALPEKYLILEVSPELAERQRSALAHLPDDLKRRVAWIDGLPQGFKGVILANEVADALPVERLRWRQGGLEQAWVTSDGDAFGIEWRSAPVSVAPAFAEHGLPDGYETTWSTSLGPWVRDLVGSLDTGLALIFDYGTGRSDYLNAERSGGWLRCHFRHRAHDDPFVLVGIQDITAWVDFTSIAEAAVDAGAEVAGYVTQAQFLLQGGLDEEFAAASPADERGRLEFAQQIKRLTLPSEMGENFKCIGLKKGNAPLPPAFQGIDLSASL